MITYTLMLVAVFVWPDASGVVHTTVHEITGIESMQQCVVIQEELEDMLHPLQIQHSSCTALQFM